MKQLWCAMSLMAGSLLFSVNASADTSSGALLQQMNLASQSLNYELSFVSINKQGVESLRYRHARLNNQPLAQLLQLDGPRREVVLRGTEISYFEPGLDPFTLNGDYIVDSLPSLVYSDFKRLSAAYDFISVGRTRIADRLCDVIRVVARDGTRYSFIAWLDAETKLPLRVDLLDRDGETLEQFRVVSFNVGDNVSASMETLAKANLPPQLSVPEGATKPTSTGRQHGFPRGWLKFPAVSAVCPLLTVQSNHVSIPTACSASRSISTAPRRPAVTSCCAPADVPSARRYAITRRSPWWANCRRRRRSVSLTVLNSRQYND